MIKIRAIETINLSATGSRNAPSFELWLNSLATQPSNQSVMEAIIKITAVMGLERSMGRKKTITMRGIQTIRIKVRRLATLYVLFIFTDYSMD
jgi:hypothetical protein